jgi:hypothetical protein
MRYQQTDWPATASVFLAALRRHFNTGDFGYLGRGVGNNL